MTTIDEQITSQFVIHDERIRSGKIRVQSNRPKISDKLNALQSEDAKVLALRHAVDKGYASPSVKYAALEYCDPNTLQPFRSLQQATLTKNAEPMLVVDFHSDTFAIGNLTGDSLS